MSSSRDKDEADRGTNSAQDAPYKVGNKKPPLHSRYKPGQSGNRSGRPKGRTNFGAILMEEILQDNSSDEERQARKLDQKTGLRRFGYLGRHYEGPAVEGVVAELP